MSGTVNIYAQSSPHDNVWIAGDEIGLRRLIVCLQSAINSGIEQVGAYSSDGEGYELICLKLSKQGLDLLKKQYTDPDFSIGDGVYPWELPAQYRYYLQNETIQE